MNTKKTAHKHKSTIKSKRRVRLDPDKSLEELIDLWLRTGKVKQDENGCLVWQGAKNNNGFAVLKSAGRFFTVNRLILEKKLERELSDSEIAYQSCKNPSCINPEHLSPVEFEHKPKSISLRLTEPTLKRLKVFWDKDAPRWNRRESWKADTIRKVVGTALAHLDEQKNQLIYDKVKPEPGGTSYVVSVSQEMHELIDLQRLRRHEEMYATIRWLIELGLQILEKRIN